MTPSDIQRIEALAKEATPFSDADLMRYALARKEMDDVSTPRPGECPDAPVLARYEDDTPAMFMRKTE